MSYGSVTNTFLTILVLCLILSHLVSCLVPYCLVIVLCFGFGLGIGNRLRLCCVSQKIVFEREKATKVLNQHPLYLYQVATLPSS